jgi:integrase
MQSNFYTKPKFNNPNTISKRKDSVLFLDYLAHFISNSATKRVQGYGTVGLAKNTIRTYNSLHRVVKDFEFAKSEILYINTIDKYTAESFTHFLKTDQHYSDNYCGQLLKLLKVILRDAVKTGLEEVHPFSNYIESFKQKSSDRILHILNPAEIKALKELRDIPEVYTDSYRWLLVGLSIGQRVSDLLNLSPNNLRKAPTGLYIDILQQKTKKAVTVGLADPLVIDILEE